MTACEEQLEFIGWLDELDPIATLQDDKGESVEDDDGETIDDDDVG